MDPLAHTLFGAALAESGLKHRTRHATATLLIGANLPDLDVVAGLWGSDFELYARRGHTHGILAMLVLPLLLTGAVLLWQRWQTRRNGTPSSPGEAALRTAVAAPATTHAPASPPFNPRAILLLSFIGVLSHPLLDWMNTYGVRLLMPFDGRWFYGDTLFIVEPWFWVLTAVGVVLARSASRPAIAGWLVLAALATGLVLSTQLVSTGVKIIWCLAVAAVIALRLTRPGWASTVRMARAGLLVLFLYMGAAFALARIAEATLAQHYPQALQVQANPPPATPRAHRMVIEEPDRYRIITGAGQVHDLPRTAPDAIVQAALDSPDIRGFVNWMRFPAWTVEDRGDHWRVRILDLRYQGPDVPASGGIGSAVVDIPKSASHIRGP